MFLLTACNDGHVLTTVMIVLKILNIIKVLLAVIVIIFGIIDFSKVVVDSKDGKLGEAISMFIRRIIAALIVFFVPTIINGVLKAVSSEAHNYKECIENATPEGIKNAYYNKAKEMIKDAKENLDTSTYADALSYLSNVKDDSRKAELEKELKQVKEYVDLMNEVLGMNESKQYDSIKSEVNSVKDSAVRTKLTEALEKRKKIVEAEEKKKEEFDKKAEERKKQEQQQQQQGQQGQQQVDLGGTIIKQEDTDTLKVTIRKVNSYYLTQVWVKDPYNQLNKYDSHQYGRNLYKPGTLLSYAVSQRGLSNKLVVGFNASGFYLRDTYDAASVNYYAPYDRTSVGTLVITNGQVVRNAYDKAYKTWFIAGVDRSGTLQIYTDAKSNDAASKKSWSEGVISNIRNTFTFASPLVMNGQASNITTSMPASGSAVNRQAFCQIDNNNFLLITGAGLTRQDLINIMLSANCQTGTNFDGGGSIALLYKSKNSNGIETIIGNGRSLTEVGYFSE